MSAGLRPRLACEVRPEGVVAARADDAAGVLAAVAQAPLPVGAVVPGLKPGNLVQRAAVVSALREALDALALRTRDITLVVPDAAARVLLVEFDELPGKLADALPLVRFRLKKMLPFEADDAAVSYQVMSSTRNMVKVLAVAMPAAVLEEYESAVREAGYEPGAVLPSTLAALAALVEDQEREAALVVNASNHAVTTAIVRAGLVLLHRSIDMGLDARVEEEAEAVLEQAVQAEAEYGEGDVFSHALETEAVKTVVMSEAVIAHEVAQAISVAAAYYEDTLGEAAGEILTSGPFGAEGLQSMVGMAEMDVLGIRSVRELMGPGQLLAGAVTSTIPRGVLAGVAGALRA